MPNPPDPTAPAVPALTPYGRRAFLAEASGLAIAAGLGACGGGGTTDPPVGPQTVFSFAKNDKLSTVGGSIVTEVISQGRNVLLIIARTGQSSAVALSATCTHTGCAVAYDGASAFRCPCHGSAFSLTGEVQGGPAPTPLNRYTATVTTEGISVSIPT